MTHTNPNEGCDSHSERLRQRICDQSRLNTFLSAIYNSPQNGRSRIRIILIGAIEDVTQQNPSLSSLRSGSATVESATAYP
jgi:hypothetical protein